MRCADCDGCIATWRDRLRGSAQRRGRREGREKSKISGRRMDHHKILKTTSFFLRRARGPATQAEELSAHASQLRSKGLLTKSQRASGLYIPTFLPARESCMVCGIH